MPIQEVQAADAIRSSAEADRARQVAQERAAQAAAERKAQADAAPKSTQDVARTTSVTGAIVDESA